MGLASTVYLLCCLASLSCALLLWRAYARGVRGFLVWSALGFTALALNNLLLVLDLVIFPMHVDLTLWRSGTLLLGLGVLLFGFIWDAP